MFGLYVHESVLTLNRELSTVVVQGHIGTLKGLYVQVMSPSYYLMHYCTAFIQHFSNLPESVW